MENDKEAIEKMAISIGLEGFDRNLIEDLEGKSLFKGFMKSW